MKTILLADSERHVRNALRLSIDYQPDLQVIGEAESAESLLAQSGSSCPDIILLDWDLPGLHPQRMISALRMCCSGTLILVTSVRPEVELTIRGLDVDGFIVKAHSPANYFSFLQEAIERSTGLEDEDQRPSKKK
jgi:two-component system response regulator DesR